MRKQLLIDTLRSAPQREFAQRGQVGRRKEIGQRAFRLLRNVDFSLLEALDQIVRRQINQFDRIGAIEHGIRHGFTHPDMGDLRNDIIQAVNMLDVDCGVDVDAAAQQLFDIKIPLGMTAALGIGMGELIDQNDLGAPDDDGIEVHLLQPLPLVLEPATRNDLQSFEQRFGFFAPMSFDDSDDDDVAVFLPSVGLLKHLVGFADAGRRAHEDSKLADAAIFLSRRLEQGFWRRSIFNVAPLICHR